MIKKELYDQFEYMRIISNNDVINMLQIELMKKDKEIYKLNDIIQTLKREENMEEIGHVHCNIIKDMVYTSEKTRELLYHDKYNGYKYYILSLGSHPTAYIEIPKGYELYGVEYDNIDLDVHGGLTYGCEYLKISDDNTLSDSWFIGWDYSHCNDYVEYKCSSNYKEENLKKWTTEEIIEECKNAIDLLHRMKMKIRYEVEY